MGRIYVEYDIWKWKTPVRRELLTRHVPPRGARCVLRADVHAPDRVTVP